LQPFHQCLGDLLRPLKCGQVTAVRHHYQAYTLDPAGDVGRSVGRDQLIAVADQDQRRAADAGKSRPRVRAAHDRLLLAGEASAAGQRDLCLAPLGLFGGVGASGGVQQRESGHGSGAWRRISKAM
jgi:hypothetical protein